MEWSMRRADVALKSRLRAALNRRAEGVDDLLALIPMVNKRLAEQWPAAPPATIDLVIGCHPLHHALFLEDLRFVERLLRVGNADPNSYDRNGCTMFQKACALHDASCAYLMLRYGADPRKRSLQRQPETALTVAARRGHLDLVRTFVGDMGVAPTAQDAACTVGWWGFHSDVAAYLFDRMEEEGERDGDDLPGTFLHAAIGEMHLGAVRFVARRYPDHPSLRQCRNGRSPVMALLGRHCNLYIIDHGARFRTPATPTFQEVQELLELLLALGADPNQPQAAEEGEEEEEQHAAQSGDCPLDQVMRLTDASKRTTLLRILFRHGAIDMRAAEGSSERAAVEAERERWLHESVDAVRATGDALPRPLPEALREDIAARARFPRAASADRTRLLQMLSGPTL